MPWDEQPVLLPMKRAGVILLVSELRTLQKVAQSTQLKADVPPSMLQDLELLKILGLIARRGASYQVTEWVADLLEKEPTYQLGNFFPLRLCSSLGPRCQRLRCVAAKAHW